MIGADSIRVLNGRTKFEVRHVVGNLHVGIPTCEVISEMHQRLEKTNSVKESNRDLRRAVYIYAAMVHNHNRNFCARWRF
jgi:phage FluMu protein Com